jgi:hypothetical protein
MASGDVVMLAQEAGGGTTFTVTTTVDLAVMGWGFISMGNLPLENYVASTSGYGLWLKDPDSANPNNMGNFRPVIPAGTLITKTNVDVDQYGVQVSCIEL